MPVRQGVRSPYLASSRPSPSTETSRSLASSALSGPFKRSTSASSTAATNAATCRLIDNSRNVYLRVRLPRCGVTVMCRPEIFWQCPTVLQVLYADVRAILAVLPRSVHGLIRRTKIWVNHAYAYGLASQPVVVQHTTAHHHHEWLLWARDRVDKAMSIEIYNATDFLRMRQHWNGCGLLLHEYCHVIHQHVLGLHNQRIIDMYKDATRSKRYEKALRRDWAGKDIEHDMAYCMVDQKEFFAEMSVTFLSKGYRDLDNPTDKNRIDACSPPIIEPNVRTRLMKNPKGSHAALLAAFDRAEGHCNKFQPFTAGQLRNHDPDLFQRMAALWDSIAAWKDTEKETACCAKSWCAALRAPPKPKSLIVTADTVSL